MADQEPLLSIRNLTVSYRLPDALAVTVDDASLDLAPGEALALIGESGCGKSSLATAILRTGAPNVVVDSASRILFRGRDLLTLGDEELRRFRWAEAAMVFQAAQNAFNPTLRLGEQFLDTMADHGMLRGAEGNRAHLAELLSLVRLETGRVLPAYPHQLSGGMRQRALVALALVLEPEFLILDEPTTALDTIMQHYVLDILRNVQRTRGMAMLLVTHDLGAAARLCSRVAVMYAGHVVEVGPLAKVFTSARHPYARALVDALPSVHGDVTRHKAIPGAMPDPLSRPPGCPFHPRCPRALPLCSETRPSLTTAGDGGLVACHLEEAHEPR